MKILATIIKKAAQLREDSYDHERADAAAANYEMNFEQFYRNTKDEAAFAACMMHDEEHLAPIVTMLLQSNWNEALDWANTVLEG